MALALGLFDGAQAGWAVAVVVLPHLDIAVDPESVTVRPTRGGQPLVMVDSIRPQVIRENMVLEWVFPDGPERAQTVDGIGFFNPDGLMLFTAGLSPPGYVVLYPRDVLTVTIPVKPTYGSDVERLHAKIAAILQETYLDVGRRPTDEVAARRIWSYLRGQGVRTEGEVAAIVAAAGGEVTLNDDVLRDPPRVRETRSPYGDLRLETY